MGAEQTARSRDRRGNGSVLANTASHTRLVCALHALAVVMRSLQQSAKERAFMAMNCKVQNASTRERAVASLVCCLLQAFKRASHATVLHSWNRLRAVHRPRASDPGAFAQALVEAWDPLWAPRIILIQWALLRLVRVALQGPWRLLRAQVKLRPIVAIRHAEDVTSRVIVSARCRCLVTILQSCIKRKLGHALRIMAYARVQEDIIGTLETLEHSCMRAEACMHW